MLKIAANEKNKFPGLMQIENPRTNPNSKLNILYSHLPEMYSLNIL
jgi:hypothetical protein